MHHIITILFDRANPEERVRAEACLRVLIDDAAKLGYGEYRTHLAYYGTYDALGTGCFSTTAWRADARPMPTLSARRPSRVDVRVA